MPSDAKYINLVIKRLQGRYGKSPRTQLVHKNMCELFVAVLLSPQCADPQVNKTTSVMFRHLRTFGDYASADPRTLRHYLKGLNYYKTKAKHLKLSAAMIIDRFDGQVPRTLEELMELPGVGRKVANVILNEGYGMDEGIAVDTHCGRVAVRLGLSKHSKKPEKIERDLMDKVPKELWGVTSNLFIELGRDVCSARNRQCGECVLKDICPSSIKPRA